MNLFVRCAVAYKPVVALLLAAVFTAGCSGSSDSSSSQSLITSTNANAAEMDESNIPFGELSGDDSNNPTADSLIPDTTRVTFDITVPVYVSNALQVRLIWGDKDLNASWVADESWSVTDDFPNQTQHPLSVSFNDGNGSITLASYETEFETGAAVTQSVRINADQFDTASWDTDADGVNNLAESIAGTNPQGDDLPGAAQASLELVPDKTFRLAWPATDGASFYRVLENPDGVSGFTQVGDDLSASALSYDHRVPLYKRVNARYIVQACNAIGCTDSTTLTLSTSLEAAITYVKASNAGVHDSFGGGVALSHDGNILAVGASGEDSASTQINGEQSDNEARGAGAVYIFERVNGQWQQQAYLKASNAQAGDGFGGAIGLSADGNTLAVGASGEDSFVKELTDSYSGHDTNYGAAYVFTRESGGWVQQAYLKAGNGGYRNFFGGKLSLSADGNTLAVGVAWEGSGGKAVNTDLSIAGYAYRSGAVYVFVRAGDAWEQQAHVKASNAGGGQRDQDGDYYGGDSFGHSVSLSADGNTLAVGAIGEDSDSTGIDGVQFDGLARDSGAAYVFSRSGTTWQEQAYIKASNTEKWDAFGSAVSLDSTGNTLAVLASGEDSMATGIDGDQSDNSDDNAGAVYVFSLSNGNWQQQSYLKASRADSPFFGLMPDSFSADGKLLAVGNNVYAYRDAAWQLQTDLQDISGNEKVYSGRAVISGDGNTIAIGDFSDESSDTGLNGDRYDYFAVNAGAVYLY